MIQDVVYFNRIVLGVTRTQPALLSEEEATWLGMALAEEIGEFEEAHHDRSIPRSVDALIDLIYFAIGGLYRLGLSEGQIADCFSAVHEANLTKRIGVKSSRPQDGSVADAVKTPDFADPIHEIREILNVGA